MVGSSAIEIFIRQIDNAIEKKEFMSVLQAIKHDAVTNIPVWNWSCQGQ